MCFPPMNSRHNNLRTAVSAQATNCILIWLTPTTVFFRLNTTTVVGKRGVVMNLR